MEGGHREESMMHVEGVCDARCGSFREGSVMLMKGAHGAWREGIGRGL